MHEYTSQIILPVSIWNSKTKGMRDPVRRCYYSVCLQLVPIQYISSEHFILQNEMKNDMVHGLIGIHLDALSIVR